MKDHQALLATVGAIYATVFDEAPETGWLDGVRDWMGAEHVCLNEVGEAGARWWSCSRFNQTERALGDRFVNEPVYALALEQAPRMQPVRLSAFVPVRALQRTDVYQQLIRPMNGGIAAIGAWRHDGVLGALTICRSAESDADFDDGEIVAMHPLLVHVRNAVRMRAALRRTEAALAHARAALDAVRDGVVIIDHQGRIRHANAEARRILAVGDGLVSRAGALHAVRPGDDRMLQQLVRRTLELGVATRTRRPQEPAALLHAAGHVVKVVRARRPRPLFVAAAPSAGRSGLLDGDAGEAAVLLLRDPEQVDASRVESLCILFGLTRREAELAEAIAAGAALSQAAGDLGIAEGTARQYLKGVFAKTGTHRQAELVALLRFAG